jgi:hypothetical protein
MQARTPKSCLDISLSEGSKEGLLKGCDKVDLYNMEDMVSNQVLVLF